MTRLLFVLLGLLILGSCASSKNNSKKEISNTTELLEAMHKKYKGKWFNQFTFVQETIKYDADGNETETSIWYEAIDYPKKFRIDYGPLSDGNAVIFDKDSVWVFKEKQLTRKAYSPREFLLMKGGLYHFSVDETITQLKNYGYNPDIFRTAILNDKLVYVIGAEKGDLTSKQFWVDAENFFLVRRISSQKKTLDVIYSDHIFSNGGWVEQLVEFWVDGIYVQKEYYKDIDTKPKLSDAIFDPQLFGKTHWFKQ